MKTIQEMRTFAKENKVPIVMDDALEIILEYIEEHKVKRILEVGTAIGYSAIQMALVDDEICIDSLEIDEEAYEEARRNIEDFKLEDRIQVHLVDAIEFETKKEFDLIFIDAAKAQYPRHMKHFEGNLAEDGVFIFDNLEFHGMVDHPWMTKNHRTQDLIRKLKTFRDGMLDSKDYTVRYYKEIGDGLMLLRPKK